MIQVFAGIGVLLGTVVMLTMIFRGLNLLTAILTAAVIIVGFGLVGLGLENLWDEVAAAF